MSIEAMKTLHLDYGREMQGGQWQVLYLVERLGDARLKTRCEELVCEARKRGIQLYERSAPEHFDLTHAHDARAHFAAISRAPLVVSRRVGFPIKQAFTSRFKYKRASMFIAVSAFVRAGMLEFGIDADRIRVVYDGIPVPTQITRRAPGRVVALASKPVEIAGMPIHLTTDLWTDLQTASVFVYRSEMEGLGSAALAAQAMGVPVVASNVGGLPEAVEHERTGLLVDNDNFEPAVRRLLQNPKQAEDMGMQGRERIAKNFTIDIMVEKTKQVYEEALRR